MKVIFQQLVIHEYSFKMCCKRSRWSIYNGGLPKMAILNVILPLALLLQYHGVTAQPLEIRKAVKEELLPGYIIAELSTEPDFLTIVNSALNSGSITKNSGSGGNLHYSVLTSGNSHGQYFAVDPSSGAVSIKRNIDREQVCSFRDECQLSFQVAARSVYGVFFHLVNFNIVVIDINDNSPEFIQTQFLLNIPENADVGRSFQLPTAFDRDTGASNMVKEYRILTGPSFFGLKTVQTGINSSDLFLSLDEALARESAMVHKVLVGAIDGGIPPLTGTLTVEVAISDVNDNFPIFEQSLYSKNIPETAGVDQMLAQVHATDADSGLNGEVVYSFSAQQPQDDLSFFRVDAKTGEIFLAKSVEARAGAEIDLVVEASDGGHPPKTSRTLVKVLVEDTINSVPEVNVDTLGGATEGVAEVSEYAEVGKVVAYVSVRDADSGDNGQTSCQLNSREFQMVKLDDSGKFKIELMAALDRELNEFYNITLTCSDSGFPPLMTKADFAVKVLDENDHQPVFSVRNYEATVYENLTVGAVITQLTVTDGDIGSNADISFDIIGTNNHYFDIDETGAVTVKVLLDRENSDKIVVTVVASDAGIPPSSSSATLTVNVQDINDVIPEFSQDLYTFEVEEEQPAGRLVGVLAAFDKDLGANKDIFYRFQYSRMQHSDVFLLGNDDGVIRTNGVLDREQKDVYSFIVLAIDKGVPPLTGTTSVIIKILDANDNNPYFIHPVPENNTIIIPHTVEPRKEIMAVQAHDLDTDLNAKIIYSISSVNISAPFDIDPIAGTLFTKTRLTRADIGLFSLTIVANDQGPKQQRATQIPLYIEVFFDNSTIVASVTTAGLSREIITAIIIVSLVMLVAVVVFVTLMCLRRQKVKTKPRGNVPASASTSSTAKLQGGYYIAPGVHGSSSFTGKQNPGTCNNNEDHDMRDGTRITSPCDVMVSRTDAETPAEIIEISINGYQNGFNDTLELNRLEDDRFSTFRSQEDILSPGNRYGSLRRQEQHSPSVSKGTNDTSDEESTSDSGRGGSDMDVNNAAAAAKQEKARPKDAPFSVKSGISHTLSPHPQQEAALITFRGESPNYFNFDSDSETLTRNSQASRGISAPVMLPKPNKDVPKFGSGSASAFSGPSIQRRESDNNKKQPTSHNLSLLPRNATESYSHSDPINAEEGDSTGCPHRLDAPKFTFSNSTFPRHESESSQSHRGLNPSNSLTRRNQIPIHHPNTDFTYYDYGGYTGNNNNRAPKTQGSIPDYIEPESGTFSSPTAYDRSRGSDHNYEDRIRDRSARCHDTMSPRNYTYNDAVGNHSNEEDELPEFHPGSVEEDFLLPPYPEEHGEDDDDIINIHPGYTDYNPDSEVEKSSLFSRFESNV